MKKTLLLLLALYSAGASAQMYFSTNSYMYVGDQFVYVTQDVNLQASSNIYLRRGGQLIQGTTGVSTNQGAGKLSVFQEGNVDNFEYNYWCSPIGNASGGSGNENFGITMIQRPNGVNTSVPATILPTSSLNGTADSSNLPTSLSIAPRWVFRYLSDTNYSGWLTNTTGAATVIEPGQGFTMKGTSGDDTFFSENGVANNPAGINAQRYDFRGKPNDGNINITVMPGKMTLTGNPYPSSINLRAFLLAETNCTGIAYFWEQDKNVNSHVLQNYQGGYGSYASGSNIYLAPTFYGYNSAGTQLGVVGAGTNYPREFSPVGQGFMIEGASTVLGPVVMSNNRRIFKREGVDTAFSRPAGTSSETNSVESDVAPHIRFNILLSENAVRPLILSFSPLATDGVDRAFDAKSGGGGGNADCFFPIEGNEYGIAAVNFDINKKVPIAFKSTVAQNFKITVSEMVNFSDAQHVYLHDKITDMYHEIVGGVYEFSLAAGSDTSRYEITFVDSALGVTEIGDTTFDVLQNNTNQQLEISNPEQVELKSCALYDMTGKLIFSKANLGSDVNYTFSTAGLSEGIYIVKLMTAKGQDFGKKISIFRKEN